MFRCTDRFTKKCGRRFFNGEIPAKSRIPSSRSLAAQLGVSRMTVVNAYDQLFAEGYLGRQNRRGNVCCRRVARRTAANARNASRKNCRFFARVKFVRARQTNGGEIWTTLLCEHSANKFVPFQNGLTAIDSFPFDTWARIAARWNRHAPPTNAGERRFSGFLSAATSDRRAFENRSRRQLRTRTSYHYSRSAAGAGFNQRGFFRAQATKFGWKIRVTRAPAVYLRWRKQN